MAYAIIAASEDCLGWYLCFGYHVSDMLHHISLILVLTKLVTQHNRHLRSPHRDRIWSRPRRPNLRLSTKVTTIMPGAFAGYHRCLPTTTCTSDPKDVPNVHPVPNGTQTGTKVITCWLLEDTSFIDRANRGPGNTAGLGTAVYNGEKIPWAGPGTDHYNVRLVNSFG